MDVTVSSLGEKALIIRFEQEINEHVNQQVIQLEQSIEQADIVGLKELVPAYCSLVIHYEPYEVWQHLKLTRKDGTPSVYMKHAVNECVIKWKTIRNTIKAPSRIVEIPVCYGGKFGSDLQDVARHNELSQEQVIAIHSHQPYLVHMLGFAPGFPYLGGMDERIATPRKAIPRSKIEPGSVGIAGAQTGIYPIETPGGWRIIGRTPLSLFRPEQETPTLIQAGDYVKFIPITAEQFDDIRAKQWI